MSGHGRCARHRTYDLSCEEFDWLRERSGQRCEHCHVPEAETPHQQLHIDHDARIGWHAVRGLLCSKCNTSLDRGLLDPTSAGRYLAAPFWKDLRVLASRAARVEREQAAQALLTDLGRFKKTGGGAEFHAARDAAVALVLAAGHRQLAVADAAGLSQSRVQVIARKARAQLDHAATAPSMTSRP